MQIVDSQVHIWAASTPERPWPARHKPHRPVPMTKDDLLREMAAAGVDRAILVPPSWEGERNDIALAAAQAHSDRFAVMGRFDPAAQSSRKLIKTWRSQPGMLGLRFTFHWPLLQPLLTEGKLDWMWPEAEQAGVPIMMTCPTPIMYIIDGIAERYPGLKLVVDHMGIPMGAKDEMAFREIDKLLALARRPNIAVKATSLPCYSTDVYPYRNLHPYIRLVYDAFGPKRMFWGTDLSRLIGTYREAVTMFTEELQWLTTEDKEWIMGRGVQEWIGWK
jgi:L-fuconolactonase